MSEREFDAYLALLTRFLRLSARQREDIRRELRAHLDEALDDYVARGLSRHEAALRALEDFGDAAELAARFRAIGRTRRWIMRGTATAAGIGILLLSATYFTTHPATPAQAGFDLRPSLQAADARGGGLRAGVLANEADDSANAELLAALGKKIADVKFEQQPLESVIEYLATETKANVVVNWSALGEHNVERDRPVELRLRNVSAERVLRLVLAQISQGATEVSYQADHGILMISTLESLKREMTTRVYDVRDLLTAGLDWQKTKERLSGLQKAAAGAAAADPLAIAPPAGAGAAAGGVGKAPAAEPAVTDDEIDWPECALISAVTETVEPESWVTCGGSGSAKTYNGVLIIRQHERAHEDVERLLQLLRDAGAGAEGMAAR